LTIDEYTSKLYVAVSKRPDIVYTIRGKVDTTQILTLLSPDIIVIPLQYDITLPIILAQHIHHRVHINTIQANVNMLSSSDTTNRGKRKERVPPSDGHLLKCRKHNKTLGLSRFMVY